MKRFLSLFLAVIISVAPMVVLAEEPVLGSYENPYQLISDSMTPLAITVSPGCDAYVKVDDANNSVVTVGFATHDGYFLQYGRQTVPAGSDGTCELTMNAFLDVFSVYNSGETDVVVYLKLAAGAPVSAGTLDNPEELVLEANWLGNLSAYVSTELAFASQGYYYVWHATEAGYFNVSVSAFDAENEPLGWVFCVNNVTAGIYDDNHYSDDEELIDYKSVKVNAGDEVIIFANTYDPANMWGNPAGFVGISASFASAGSMDFPETATPGSHSTDLAEGNQGYHYAWIATESGYVTVSMESENWQYSVNIYRAGETPDVYGDIHWSDDEDLVSSVTYPVYAGDEVAFMVATYDPANPWANPAGAVEWTLSFSPDQVPVDPEIPPVDPEGPMNPDLQDGYAFSDLYIGVGEQTYPLDTEYAYTIFTFEPSEIGEYIFTANTLMAIVSYNGMWVTVEPSSETVTENSFQWTCDSVGQSLLIATLGGFSEVVINVEKKELQIIETPEEVYQNKVEPKPFELQGAPDDLLFVDTFDNVADIAVLGTDGFYHLGTADGPILYADLDDSLMSLADATSYGQLTYVAYEDGVAVLKLDFNAAFASYAENADSETMLYPLTEDLITIFQMVGEYRSWYGSEGWVGGDLDDAWMFACYYFEKEEPAFSFGDVNGDGKVTSTDYNMLKRHVMKTYKLDEDDMLRADINEDGKINSTDYNMLKRYILKTWFPKK